MAGGALEIGCCGVRADRYSYGPTLILDLDLSRPDGRQVLAVALRCQLRVEPRRRSYSASEALSLRDLFGGRRQFEDSLNPMQLAQVAQVVTSFKGNGRASVPVPLTYDLDIACSRYFASLESGIIPLKLLFSGSVFSCDEGGGLVVEPVPWDAEVDVKMPLSVWREAIDVHFPNSGWLRLSNDTLADLQDFKSKRCLATFESAIAELIRLAREGAR